MAENSHFLFRKYAKKRDARLGLPLRYYKDNTFQSEMQIAFNILLDFCRLTLGSFGLLF